MGRPSGGDELRAYYKAKIEELELRVKDKTHNLRRLEAQRNELNTQVRLLREELQHLQEAGSYVGEVIKVMGKNKVLVKVHPEGKYVVDIDKDIDVAKLTTGARVALRNDSYTLHLVLPTKVDPLVGLMKVEKVPDSTYDMIGGADQQIKEIKEVIELPLKHPELFESLGIAQPKGVLLYGPPGTGKTLLARAVAHHTDCTFIRVSGSELVQKYIGEGARMVRELFVMAREHAPSIIFMDEVDSIGSARTDNSGGGGDSEVQRTMLELLNQLDGFEETNKIKVLMATNRIDILDAALLRPGRIDRKIEFPNPNEAARLDILRIHSRKMNLTRGIDLKKIADKMSGASGAEMKACCTEAGMFALRERRMHVTQEDFEMAVTKVMKKDSAQNMSIKKLFNSAKAAPNVKLGCVASSLEPAPGTPSHRRNGKGPGGLPEPEPPLHAKLSVHTLQKRQDAVARAELLFEVTRNKRFHAEYCRTTLVSYGASSKVLTAVHRASGKRYAAKAIPKDPANSEKQWAAVLQEVGVMKEVEDHPNAVQLFEAYNEDKQYYLVMEYCEGGELFDHISKSEDGFTERQAAKILRSMMQFLSHMHSRGMAHMDIKPENIMFDAQGAEGVLKIIDFGASMYLAADEHVRDAFGTVRYSSPEMANDIGIGQKTDVWSAGVVMYVLLCGSLPFVRSNDVDTLNYIKKAPRVKFSGSRWASVSGPAKECVRAMLEPDPSARATAAEVLQMPWLRAQLSDSALGSDILAHLRLFANQSRMRRLLLGLMASNLSGLEANRLLQEFYQMDSDSSGTIELPELVAAAHKVLPDVSEEEISRVFTALDVDHTGSIDIHEFFAGLLHTMDEGLQAALATKSFKALDTASEGFVRRELFVSSLVAQAKAAGLAGSPEEEATLRTELEAEFSSLDINRDGVLSLEEYKGVLRMLQREDGPAGLLGAVQAAAASMAPQPDKPDVSPLTEPPASPLMGRDSRRSSHSPLDAVQDPPHRSISSRILAVAGPPLASDLASVPVVTLDLVAVQSHQNLIRLALELQEQHGSRSGRTASGGGRAMSARSTASSHPELGGGAQAGPLSASQLRLRTPSAAHYAGSGDAMCAVAQLLERQRVSAPVLSLSRNPSRQRDGAPPLPRTGSAARRAAAKIGALLRPPSPHRTISDPGTPRSQHQQRGADSHPATLSPTSTAAACADNAGGDGNGGLAHGSHHHHHPLQPPAPQLAHDEASPFEHAEAAAVTAAGHHSNHRRHHQNPRFQPDLSPVASCSLAAPLPSLPRPDPPLDTTHE